MSFGLESNVDPFFEASKIVSAMVQNGWDSGGFADAFYNFDQFPSSCGVTEIDKRHPCFDERITRLKSLSDRQT